MLKNNKLALAFVIGFFVIIMMPLIFMNREEGKVSESENRVLTSFPEFVEDGKLNLSEDKWQELENWFEDNIGFRDQLMYVSSHVKYNLFKQSTSDDVEIGKDGWLFYTLYNNIELAEGTYPLTDADLSRIGETQQQVSDRLAEQGIAFFVTLAPSKTTMYPEYIASADCVVQDSASDIVKAYLLNNTDVNFIDLKTPLLTARAEEWVYMTDDVHWNAYGAYTAYNIILDEIDNELNISTEHASVEYIPDTAIGDLSRMLGKDIVAPVYTEKSDLNVVNPTYEIASEEDPLLMQLQELNPGCQISVFTNENGNGKTLLMVGDSMFGSRNWKAPFAQSFSNYVYIWGGTFGQETIDAVNPDIVVFEITERGALNLMYSEFAE